MCLFMGKIIRSTIDFLYVKGNRLSAHKIPMIRPPSGTYYLTYNVTLRQLVSGCLGRPVLIPERIASANATNKDIICIQEYRFFHKRTNV